MGPLVGVEKLLELRKCSLPLKKKIAIPNIRPSPGSQSFENQSLRTRYLKLNKGDVHAH